jgi:hypothetical protein
MPDTFNRQKETFIVAASNALQQAGGGNFADRVIDGAKGPLNLTVQNMSVDAGGNIMLEMRQGTTSLSLAVLAESLGTSTAGGVIAVDDTLAEGQAVPGTIVVTCDADTWTDDGAGALVPAEGNVSTTTGSSINYMTCAITLYATGATVSTAITADYDKGWMFAPQVRQSILVDTVDPGARIDIYGYGPNAAAKYLEVVVEGNIEGRLKGAATIAGSTYGEV